MIGHVSDVSWQQGRDIGHVSDVLWQQGRDIGHVNDVSWQQGRDIGHVSDVSWQQGRDIGMSITCHDSKAVLSVMSMMCHDSKAVISIFVLVISLVRNSSKIFFVYSIHLLLRWRHWLLSSQTTMLPPSTQRMAVSHLDRQILVNMCTTFDII